MKMNYIAKIKDWRLLAPLVLLVPLFFAPAKSSENGRFVRAATPTPSAQKTPVAVAGPEKYKFVFRPSYEGKRGYVARERAAMDKARRSSSDNFVRELNLAGASGYKLVSALLGPRVAVLKHDEGVYEYDWFETSSPVHFAKNGLEEKIREFSAKGFRVVHQSLLSASCEPLGSLDSNIGESCEYLDMFLVEREKGGKKPPEQILVGSSPGWGARPGDELEKQIDESLAKNFYPTKVFSAFEILLEKAGPGDDLPGDKPDVRVVRAAWGKADVSEKVNELARQGYRLAMTAHRIALMYRNRETAAVPVTYVWLKTEKKNFERELALLGQKGWVYKTFYPNEKGSKNTLVFERGLSDETALAEFKVLKLELAERENKAEYKIYNDLTGDSKETLRTMDRLAREGFEVRELFEADGIRLILEKTKP